VSSLTRRYDLVEANPPFTLLIVDRDRRFRALVKKHVGGSVVVVGEACDGHEAVHMAKRLHPDVVLMDIALPILDGVETARQIKADRAETKVVLLSGHGATPQLDGAGIGAEAVILNVDAVIPKDRVVSDIRTDELNAHAWNRRPRR
jgi:CheY-like chemotaxis protein